MSAGEKQQFPLAGLEDKYEVIFKIREGGMGAIYKVRHRLLDEVRVIKIIRPQHEGDQELQERFLNEARAAIRLRHPNVAQLYDFAITEEGTAYMVMEFIDGLTFKDHLEREGPFDLELAMEIAHQGLEALGYLHRQGYVHRDISPDNLMLTRDVEGRPLVKLIDLGIAKRLGGATSHLTATGMFLGKARYSSPEQFSGKTEDPRGDLYSFAAMLYELLTGERPIEGTDFSDYVAGHLVRPPRGFDETDPEGEVPEGLRRVILQMLEKDPERRLPSAEEFRARLEPHRGPLGAVSRAAVVASPPELGRGQTVVSRASSEEEARPSIDTLLGGEKKPFWKNSRLLAVAAVVIVVAAVLLGWWLAGPPPDTGEPLAIEAQRAYVEALAALEAEEWSKARHHLQEAIEIAPEEMADPAWRVEGGGGAYLPHRYLGLIRTEQQNYAQALEAWSASDRQGLRVETPDEARFREAREAVDEFFRGEVADLRERFGQEWLTQGVATLEGALAEPGLADFWGRHEALRGEIDAAVERYRKARDRLAEFERTEDWIGFFEWEDKSVDVDQEIRRLLEELGRLTNQELGAE